MSADPEVLAAVPSGVPHALKQYWEAAHESYRNSGGVVLVTDLKETISSIRIDGKSLTDAFLAVYSLLEAARARGDTREVEKIRDSVDREVIPEVVKKFGEKFGWGPTVTRSMECGSVYLFDAFLAPGAHLQAAAVGETLVGPEAKEKRKRSEKAKPKKQRGSKKAAAATGEDEGDKPKPKRKRGTKKDKSEPAEIETFADIEQPPTMEEARDNWDRYSIARGTSHESNADFRRLVRQVGKIATKTSKMEVLNDMTEAPKRFRNYASFPTTDDGYMFVPVDLDTVNTYRQSASALRDPGSLDSAIPRLSQFANYILQYAQGPLLGKGRSDNPTLLPRMCAQIHFRAASYAWVAGDRAVLERQLADNRKVVASEMEEYALMQKLADAAESDTKEPSDEKKKKKKKKEKKKSAPDKRTADITRLIRSEGAGKEFSSKKLYWTATVFGGDQTSKYWRNRIDRAFTFNSPGEFSDRIDSNLAALDSICEFKYPPKGSSEAVDLLITVTGAKSSKDEFASAVEMSEDDPFDADSYRFTQAVVQLVCDQILLCQDISLLMGSVLTNDARQFKEFATGTAPEDQFEDAWKNYADLHAVHASVLAGEMNFDQSIQALFTPEAAAVMLKHARDSKEESGISSPFKTEPPLLLPKTACKIPQLDLFTPAYNGAACTTPLCYLDTSPFDRRFGSDIGQEFHFGAPMPSVDNVRKVTESVLRSIVGDSESTYETVLEAIRVAMSRAPDAFPNLLVGYNSNSPMRHLRDLLSVYSDTDGIQTDRGSNDSLSKQIKRVWSTTVSSAFYAPLVRFRVHPDSLDEALLRLGVEGLTVTEVRDGMQVIRWKSRETGRKKTQIQELLADLARFLGVMYEKLVIWYTRDALQKVVRAIGGDDEEMKITQRATTMTMFAEAQARLVASRPLDDGDGGSKFQTDTKGVLFFKEAPEGTEEKGAPPETEEEKRERLEVAAGKKEDDDKEEQMLRGNMETEDARLAKVVKMAPWRALSSGFATQPWTIDPNQCSEADGAIRASIGVSRSTVALMLEQLACFTELTKAFVRVSRIEDERDSSGRGKGPAGQQTGTPDNVPVKAKRSSTKKKTTDVSMEVPATSALPAASTPSSASSSPRSYASLFRDNVSGIIQDMNGMGPEIRRPSSFPRIVVLDRRRDDQDVEMKAAPTAPVSSSAAPVVAMSAPVVIVSSPAAPVVPVSAPAVPTVPVSSQTATARVAPTQTVPARSPPVTVQAKKAPSPPLVVQSVKPAIGPRIDQKFKSKIEIALIEKAEYSGVELPDSLTELTDNVIARIDWSADEYTLLDRIGETAAQVIQELK